MRAINTLLDGENTEFEISYTKWLMEAFKEPSELELQEMENALYKTSSGKNQIVMYRPLNNPFYQPYQGA